MQPQVVAMIQVGLTADGLVVVGGTCPPARHHMLMMLEEAKAYLSERYAGAAEKQIEVAGPGLVNRLNGKN